MFFCAQFVHDQTLRYMNKGLLPDEIAAVIRLPEHMAAHPYLWEFYGKAKPHAYIHTHMHIVLLHTYTHMLRVPSRVN